MEQGLSMGQAENLCDSEIQTVQGTLGSTCPRRRARGTSALEVVSKIPAITRDTKSPTREYVPSATKQPRHIRSQVVLVQTCPPKTCRNQKQKRLVARPH